MSDLTYFTPPNLLREKLEAGEGMSISDALERATALVDEMSGELQAAVDADIDQALKALVEAGPGRIEDLYDCADRMVAASEACGLAALSAAALSLCDLLDWLECEGRWESDIVAAHVVALVVLRAHPPARLSLTVLHSLATMRARFSPTLVGA